MRCVWFALLLLVSSALATAQKDTTSLMDTGNGYLDVCDHADVLPAVGMTCLAYVNGVIEGITLEHDFAKKRGAATIGAPFCVPQGVTLGQEGAIVVKYMKAHPEKTHLATAVLILGAIRDAFPCVR